MTYQINIKKISKSLRFSSILDLVVKNIDTNPLNIILYLTNVTIQEVSLQKKLFLINFLICIYVHI